MVPLRHCGLLSLPCELLERIGQYLLPSDLENYLAVLTTLPIIRPELADFTTTMTQAYYRTGLIELDQAVPDLELAKIDNSAIPWLVFANTAHFQPDRFELTLVNGYRHGPVKFYRSDQLVGQGHYRDNLKSGYWQLQEEVYQTGLDWTRRRSYSESGCYQADQRQGNWSITQLVVRTSFIPVLNYTNLTEASVSYQKGRKTGLLTAQLKTLPLVRGPEQYQNAVESQLSTITGCFDDDKAQGVWLNRDQHSLKSYEFIDGVTEDY